MEVETILHLGERPSSRKIFENQWHHSGFFQENTFFKKKIPLTGVSSIQHFILQLHVQRMTPVIQLAIVFALFVQVFACSLLSLSHRPYIFMISNISNWY